ncbi:recombinase family protein [bacterium]|nr:recombinase family protein [bacterium]
MDEVRNPKLRAVAYLRRSTRDQQENSIYNQRQAIDAFAERHEIRVVKYLIDDGISGLTMEKRGAFKQLINDYVIGGKMDFSLILVLDVTRWGRFQDIDESAHLEYLCRKHGKEIIYITEAFKNDNSIMDAVIKSIKRAMAAEYSKNLGDKVLAGSLTIAAQGYRVGGTAPYGYERMRLDQERKPVSILHDGQHKAIANERVTLTPGDSPEVETVRDIFHSFTEQQIHEAKIAIKLNQRRIPAPGGKDWTESSIRVILRKEIYTGAQIYNKTTQRLNNPLRQNPREDWIMVPGAFEAIVSKEAFTKAQEILNQRRLTYTDQELIEKLQQLFVTNGRLNGLIIDATSGLPSSATIGKRFGSLINAYKLVGYVPPHDYRFIELKGLVQDVELSLLNRIIENLEQMGLHVVDYGSHFRINDQLNIRIVASSIRNKDGRKCWVYRFDRSQSIDITIAVRLADDEGNIQDFYYLPMIVMEVDQLFLLWFNGVYLDVFRSNNITNFYDLFADTSVINNDLKLEVTNA